VRDIWYGDARRIDAEEMDQLRRTAREAELALAVAAIELLKSKFLTLPSLASDGAIASLHAAVLACHREAIEN
jgi:hypothetical protein